MSFSITATCPNCRNYFTSDSIRKLICTFQDPTSDTRTTKPSGSMVKSLMYVHWFSRNGISHQLALIHSININRDSQRRPCSLGIRLIRAVNLLVLVLTANIRKLFIQDTKLSNQSPNIVASLGRFFFSPRTSTRQAQQDSPLTWCVGLYAWRLWVLSFEIVSSLLLWLLFDVVALTVLQLLELHGGKEEVFFLLYLYFKIAFWIWA